MARTSTISDAELIDRIAAVFRSFGYDGATLAQLSDATGLQRASLYHRFPGGKEQMATEVLDDTVSWVETNLLEPLHGPDEPAVRAKRFLRSLHQFYNGGENACLQNVFSSITVDADPFGERIASAFDRWLKALTNLLLDAGHERREARRRAQKVLMLIHGGLVLSRGLRSTRPFRQSLREIRRLLPQ